MNLGFAIKEDEEKTKAREYDRMREKVTAQLKQTFRPEFLNRIDAVVVFHSLAKEQIRQIVELELGRVRKQLSEQEIELEVTEAAMDLLGERGYDHTYGARPLRRIIQNLIEDPLAEGVLDSRFQSGSTVRVDVETTSSSSSWQQPKEGARGCRSPRSNSRRKNGAATRPPHPVSLASVDSRRTSEDTVAKVKTSFICQQCGVSSHAYLGRCPGCGAWNSMIETIEERPQPARAGGDVQPSCRNR